MGGRATLLLDHRVRIALTSGHGAVQCTAVAVDGTAFDCELDYSQGKPQNFMTKEISKRGQILADLLDLRKPIR